jgi:PAS domain S-box-containing protein
MNDKPTYEELENQIAELKKKAVFFQLMVDNGLFVEFFRDITGKILYCNNAFENLTGYSVEEFINGQISEKDFVHPADWEMVLKQMKETIKQINPETNYEFRILTKQKDIKSISLYSQPVYQQDIFIGFRISITDITILKEAKEKAEKSEQMYHLLINSLPNSAVHLIDKELRYLISGGEEIVKNNFDVSLINGKTLREAFPKDVSDLFEPMFQKALNGEPTVFEMNYETFTYLQQILPVKNKSGDIFGAMQISTNITEKKQAQFLTNQKNELLLLQLAKEKAEESEILKTAFLQNMSHEIRTPLNAISGFSGMLNKPDLSEEKRKSFVSIIHNSSKQLISIVSDILTISSLEKQQEKANIDKVCINNVIGDLLAIFKLQAINQNISLNAKQQLSDKQSEIYTDKTKIIQILTNLIGNALKFTHEGLVEFGYNLKENELEFYVKDSGIGIKLEFHEKIFERFRQADKSINKLYSGTGLGLTISKAFVELLGGKIWVQSELEKGSTFYFTIPYKPVNEIDQSTLPNIQNENFRTVLVAEDEECNFLYIEAVLIDLDLKLIHAKNGRETVEIFKSNPNIDLILMDIKMPIMTGYDAATIIKELKPELPIIAQSAYALEHERAKYEGIFDDYLTKPINEDYLKQMVMKYIKIEKFR